MTYTLCIRHSLNTSVESATTTLLFADLTAADRSATFLLCFYESRVELCGERRRQDGGCSDAIVARSRGLLKQTFDFVSA